MLPYKTTISRNVLGNSRNFLEISRNKCDRTPGARSLLKFAVQEDSGLGGGQREYNLMGTLLRHSSFRSHHLGNLIPSFCTMWVHLASLALASNSALGHQKLFLYSSYRENICGEPTVHHTYLLDLV